MRYLRQRSGNAVIIVIVIVLAVGAILFFVSKPFSTRVKQATRQVTEWTPENIQKDPVGYLTWALDETAKTENKLNASMISLKTKRNQAEREAVAKQVEETNYTQLLAEAKEVYTKAAAEGTWPAELRGVPLTQAQLKSRIVEAHDRVTQLGLLMATYKQTGGVIERKEAEVQSKLGEVRKLKSKLSTDLEIAKVQKSVDGIGDISDRLNAIMDTSEALASTAEAGTSLDDLVTPTGAQRVDDEFSKIMGE